MKKRLLLVKPPERSRFNFGAFSLGVLAAAVRDEAEVVILDATDMSREETVKQIHTFHPDLTGITAMGLSSVEPVRLLIKAIKNRIRPVRSGGGGMVIAGGHGATMAPARLLEAGADAVVMGEGELTLQQIVREGVCPGSPGTACRVGGEIVFGSPQKLIRPLEGLYHPARDLMPLPPDGVHLMETSRGCPHACRFCETTRFFGQTWRPYSPERVAAEVKRLTREYRAWIIHFSDDNFAASPRRVIEICDRLKKTALPAFIMASARADDLISYPELIPAMASARILRISVGVETLEPEMTEVIQKPIPIKSYKEAFDRMRRYGIFSVASFIIGIPGERREMRNRALDLAIKAGPDSAHFLPFLPLPGIPLRLNRDTYDPDPLDVRDACRLTLAFRGHRTVRRRLREASDAGAIRGLLAAAMLRKKGPDAPETDIFSSVL